MHINKQINGLQHPLKTALCYGKSMNNERRGEYSVHTWFLKQKEIKSQLSQWVFLSKDSSSKAAHLKCLSLPSRTHYICLWKISALLFLCPPHDLCCSHLFSPICPLSTACGTPFQRNISNGLKILEYPLDRCLILIASSIPLFWSHIN